MVEFSNCDRLVPCRAMQTGAHLQATQLQGKDQKWYKSLMERRNEERRGEERRTEEKRRKEWVKNFLEHKTQANQFAPELYSCLSNCQLVAELTHNVTIHDVIQPRYMWLSNATQRNSRSYAYAQATYD